MAINHGTSVHAGTVSAASVTISNFVTLSGTDALLVVRVMYDNNGGSGPQTCDDVTFGGISLGSAFGIIANGDDGKSEIWFLKGSQVTGTEDIVATFDTNTDGTIWVEVKDYTNVDQTTPLSNFAGNTGRDTLATVTVTSVTGEVVIGCGTVEDVTFTTIGAGQTEDFNTGLGGGGGRDCSASGSYEPGAASVVHSWSCGDDKWSYCGCSMKEAAAPAGLGPPEIINMLANKRGPDPIIQM